MIHTASIKFENLIIFYGGSNPILGVVVDCDVRYDNLNTNITNVENYILIEQSILRQYGDGNIVDIEFGDKFNYEINNENIPFCTIVSDILSWSSHKDRCIHRKTESNRK